MIQLEKDIPISLYERVISASRRPGNLGAVIPGAISLSMGEPDRETSPEVVRAAIAAIEAGRTHYSPLVGDPGLRADIAAWSTKTTGRPTTADEVIPTHGGSAGLAAIMLSLVGPGNTVLVPEPTFSLYIDQIAMAGAEHQWVANNADGSLDLDALAKAAPRARMIVLCNPSNPMGVVLDRAQLEGLAAIVKANPHLVLVADEAYSTIIFDGAEFVSAGSLAEIRDQVVVVGTFSKAYAMTGWRLGYVIAPSWMAERISLLHRTLNGAINTFVQDAGRVALQTHPSELRADSDRYELRRDIVMETLSALPGVTVAPPTGAFYAFPRIDVPFTSDEMTARFAAGGVIVRSGTEYGPSGEGHVRLCFATDEESLREGMVRFARVVAEMRAESHERD